MLRLAFPDHSTIRYAISSRLIRFRSPLLSESRLISFPRATEMFQFTRFASTHLCIQCGIRHRCRGFPHSDICGSKLVCQLPAAFRRLQRPSSPVIAKASTICTYSLDPITLQVIGLEFACLCRSSSIKAGSFRSLATTSESNLLRTIEQLILQSQPVLA